MILESRKAKQNLTAKNMTLLFAEFIYPCMAWMSICGSQLPLRVHMQCGKHSLL